MSPMPMGLIYLDHSSCSIFWGRIMPIHTASLELDFGPPPLCMARARCRLSQRAPSCPGTCRARKCASLHNVAMVLSSLPVFQLLGALPEGVRSWMVEQRQLSLSLESTTRRCPALLHASHPLDVRSSFASRRYYFPRSNTSLAHLKF
jgi:hypothetical protein